MATKRKVVFDSVQRVIVEEALNDSDKTFTVDTGKIWHILQILVDYTSTAVAGNRQLTVDLSDATADLLARLKIGVVQAASLNRIHNIAPGLADQTGVVDFTLNTPIPPTWVLPGGFTIRIYDSAAIDAAADDMLVRVLVDQTELPIR